MFKEKDYGKTNKQVAETGYLLFSLLGVMDYEI
jgi:hypothetical protein